MRIGRAGWTTLGFAVAGWAAWLLTLLGAPPDAPGAQQVFYSSLFAALGATSTLLLTLAARPRDPRYALRGTTPYLPHAFGASFLVIFGLWLQSLRMLTWPNALLLLGLFVLIEGAYSLATRRYWTT